MSKVLLVEGQYIFRVRARNSAGWGEWSAISRLEIDAFEEETASKVVGSKKAKKKGNVKPVDSAVETERKARMAAAARLRAMDGLKSIVSLMDKPGWVPTDNGWSMEAVTEQGAATTTEVHVEELKFVINFAALAGIVVPPFPLSPPQEGEEPPPEELLYKVQVLAHQAEERVMHAKRKAATLKPWQDRYDRVGLLGLLQSVASVVKYKGPTPPGGLPDGLETVVGNAMRVVFSGFGYKLAALCTGKPKATDYATLRQQVEKFQSMMASGTRAEWETLKIASAEFLEGALHWVAGAQMPYLEKLTDLVERTGQAWTDGTNRCQAQQDRMLELLSTPEMLAEAEKLRAKSTAKLEREEKRSQAAQERKKQLAEDEVSPMDTSLDGAGRFLEDPKRSLDGAESSLDNPKYFLDDPKSSLDNPKSSLYDPKRSSTDPKRSPRDPKRSLDDPKCSLGWFNDSKRSPGDHKRSLKIG